MSRQPRKVVGDLVGSGEAQERGIVGETPNLAAQISSTMEHHRQRDAALNSFALSTFRNGRPDVRVA
jgi:hypothetical protein